MRSIINTFSEHGTFIQPDSLEYIMSKNDPEKFTSFLTKELMEYPLILTLDVIKKIEQKSKFERIPELSENSIREKTIHSDEIKTKSLFEPESDIDYYKFEKDRKINFLNLEKKECNTTNFIDFNKIRSWNPKAKEYDTEIKIIKDVTGKSTCEGTTKDFVKLFVDRYNILRKLLKNQRREMANIMPINQVP